MRRESGEYEPLFTLESWRVIVEQRADGKVETEATIKIWVDGERYVRTAEGNGPVNALDAALRAAIAEIHPHLRDIELVNYKVRILDESHGTGAVTRVLIDASDGQDVWGAIGVDENVIAASWQALVDSLEYPEQPGAGRAARRPTRRARARRERGSRTDARRTRSRSRSPARSSARRRSARSSRSCAPGQLSLGPRVPAFERRFARAAGRGRTPAPCRAAPPACTSRCARSASATATRSSRRRSRSSRARTSASSSAPARSSPTSTR